MQRADFGGATTATAEANTHPTSSTAAGYLRCLSARSSWAMLPLMSPVAMLMMMLLLLSEVLRRSANCCNNNNSSGNERKAVVLLLGW